MRRLVTAFGTGMSSDLREDPDRLTAKAVALLASFRLVGPVPGGVLALPLLGRYRSVTAQVKTRAPAVPQSVRLPEPVQISEAVQIPAPAQPPLFETVSNPSASEEAAL